MGAIAGGLGGGGLMAGLWVGGPVAVGVLPLWCVIAVTAPDPWAPNLHL